MGTRESVWLSQGSPQVSFHCGQEESLGYHTCEIKLADMAAREKCLRTACSVFIPCQVA